MNKNAIQKYAVWARNELIEQVKQRAFQYGISEKGYGEENAAVVNGRVLSPEEKRQRHEFVAKIKEQGYQQAVEEVAYTWFNRFIALRFMEVNDYLPTHIRVFSDASGEFKPEILKEALHIELEGLDKAKVSELLNASKTEELYRYLLLTQCNALHAILPEMFEKMGTYTEMLLPNNILKLDGVLARLVTDIPEEDWRDAVQIIGWMYQYYNTEPKQAVFDGLKKNIKITKEKIPAATQLFTPDWIVRYMVENSLGRLWLESHPNDQLKANWKYYIEEAEQTPEVAEKLRALREQSPVKSPEDIKLIDPCMGSGHILVYAFDVLMQIYESEGYNARDAAKLILEKNLYGLDIDRRACQLAYFSLMMKARQYNRRAFDPTSPRPQVYHPAGWSDGEEYGSLVKVDSLPPKPELPKDQLTIFDDYERDLRVWNFMRLIAQKYDVVATNPPYMGSSGMGARMSDYVKKNYPDSKSDLFAVFIERCGELLKLTGYQALITQHAWMFLSSYEKLRGKLLKCDIVNMAHLGARAFEEIGGEVVQTTAFVLSKRNTADFEAAYVRLVDYNNQQAKEEAFLSGSDRYTAKKENFEKIPGCPVAYWVSDNMLKAFKTGKLLTEVAEPKQGLKTGDNDTFLRMWYEVAFTKSTIGKGSKWFPCNKGGEYRRWYGNNDYFIDWENDGYKLKNFRHPDGRQKSRPQNLSYMGKEGLTYTNISSSNFGIRYSPKGTLFDAAGSMIFTKSDELHYLLGLLSSKVVAYMTKFLSATMSFEVGQLSNLAILYERENKPRIDTIVTDNISISRADWDSFETSWDFKRHPLLVYGYQNDYGLVDAENLTQPLIYDTEKQIFEEKKGERKHPNRCLLEDCYNTWKQVCEERFIKLKANEEELNRIFIEIYGLQNEITPEVEDKDVTVYRIFDSKEDIPESMAGSRYALTKQDVIKSFISYAVGCMFGRYSLDVEGLAFAGGCFSDQWVVVSGQYYRKEVLKKYGCTALSGSDCVAESDGFSERGLSYSQETSERGTIFPVRTDETGGSIDSVEHSGGSGKELDKGIYSISVGGTRFESGNSDATNAVRRNWIPCKYRDIGSNAIIGRSGENAVCPYSKTDCCPLITNHYHVDADNVIPICDDEYFDDDILGRFVEFVRVVYGAETLEENLKFIADALGGRGTPREAIRSYFLNDFYKDHCRTYQKRPIYWLFDSGRKNGFKALIYLHRYSRDLLAKLRTDYVHEQQERYRTQLSHIAVALNSATGAERVRLLKQQDKLTEQLKEISEFEEKVHHLADQNIEIDLDDGVKKNYAIFADVLAKI